MILKINGKNLKSLGIFNTMMTVPDCFVVKSNKIGTAHGEAKFYIASKSDMYDFYGKEKFKINCFMLKTDLLSYLFAIKNEYFNPSQNYYGKSDLPKLWNERLALVNKLDDIIYFSVNDQYQIKGPRGYVNSNDEPYQLLRQLALPLVSYIYVEKLGDEKSPLFYWKLFVDFDLIWQKQSDPLVFTYGKKKTDKLSKKDVQTTFSENEKKITFITICMSHLAGTCCQGERKECRRFRQSTCGFRFQPRAFYRKYLSSHSNALGYELLGSSDRKDG